MLGIDTLKSITNELLVSRGFAAVEFGEDNCAELTINRVPITLMYGTDPLELVWLFADLGLAPDDPRLLRGILRYGQVLWAAGQMTVALDRDGEHLVGFNSLAAKALTPEEFGEQLDRLLAGAADFLDRLEHQDFELDLPTSDTAPDPSSMDWRA
jgi:hypothetical protein